MATPKPSGTNCPSPSFNADFAPRGRVGGQDKPAEPRGEARADVLHDGAHESVPPVSRPNVKPQPPERRGQTQSGGYGGGAPPLPIPNREVKPASADGTAPAAWESRKPPLERAPGCHKRPGAQLFPPHIHTITALSPKKPTVATHACRDARLRRLYAVRREPTIAPQLYRRFPHRLDATAKGGYKIHART